MPEPYHQRRRGRTDEFERGRPHDRGGYDFLAEHGQIERAFSRRGGEIHLATEEEEEEEEEEDNLASGGGAEAVVTRRERRRLTSEAHFVILEY